MRSRAFEVLDSSCTCFMTVCLIVLESMVGRVSFNGQGAKGEKCLTVGEAAARDQ